MAKLELDQEQAESISGEQQEHAPPSIAKKHNEQVCSNIVKILLK